jgi:hypothetical protein
MAAFSFSKSTAGGCWVQLDSRMERLRRRVYFMWKFDLS